ncbi:MAG: DUF4037 domain-containing protein [Jiangellaceae bacterium]
MQLFVPPDAVAQVAAVVERGLPVSFQGWPVRYGWDDVPVGHRVKVIDIGTWLRGHFGVNPRGGLDALDWLTIPQQQLLGVVGGVVYADPDGELGSVRSAVAWYPDDVWRWMLAAQWRRVGQEEAFVGRAAEVGDALGSQLVASRMVREVMRLAFLQARVYWPYATWFGKAFSELPQVEELLAVLPMAVAATDHASREAALVAAYETVARRHNDSGLTYPVDHRALHYHSRPFRVLLAGRFADACLASVGDPLRRLPLVGSIDQLVDSTDVLSNSDRARRLHGFLAALAG